jgi:hypothetical protein
MVMVGVILVAFTIFRYTLYSLYMNITDIAYLQHLHFFYIYSVNIKFGTKFIIALSDVFKKIGHVDFISINSHVLSLAKRKSQITEQQIQKLKI